VGMPAKKIFRPENESARSYYNMIVWSSSYATIPLRYEGIGLGL
jgi:hypothetical protein